MQRIYEETNIQAIADAIRAKNGTTTTYKTSEMADAILAIESGGSSSGYWDEATVKAMIQSAGNVTDTALYNLSIPEGVTGIREYCFRQTDIRTVTFPSTLSGIGQHAFDSCTNLNSITFNEGIDTIYASAFSSCTRITELTFPSSLNSLYNFCFAACTGLTTVTFNGTPTGTINTYAFNGCTNLTDIYVPWAEGVVANAPWGATNATIHYNSTV